jgi:hypothetical protein
MLRITPFAAALVLVACASPQERCLTQAQPDLTQIDAAIIETQANLERGYALKSSGIDSVDLNFCTGSTARICIGSHSDVPGKPVAIDPQAEARKLENLRQRRFDLQAQAASDISVCNAMDG